jgi:hypothetical protein
MNTHKVRWKDFAERLRDLAQQILDELLEDDIAKSSSSAEATPDENEDFAAEAYVAAENIVDALKQFEAGQCDEESLITQAEESSTVFADIDSMSWLNATVKDRYIEFRRALRDLPEVLEHGQPLRRDYYVYVHKDQDGIFSTSAKAPVNVLGRKNVTTFGIGTSRKNYPVCCSKVNRTEKIIRSI